MGKSREGLRQGSEDHQNLMKRRGEGGFVGASQITVQSKEDSAGPAVLGHWLGEAALGISDP